MCRLFNFHKIQNRQNGNLAEGTATGVLFCLPEIQRVPFAQRLQSERVLKRYRMDYLKSIERVSKEEMLRMVGIGMIPDLQKIF